MTPTPRAKFPTPCLTTVPGHLSVKREGDDGAAFTFTNTYGVAPTDSSVTDQVKTVKRLTGRDLAAGEFTFELLEDDAVVANGTNDANGTVTLSPIRYEAPGTHTYTLREACPNALGLYKGVTYDGTTYTVVTTVSDNGDGTLTATHKLEGTTESAGFTNKYHAHAYAGFHRRGQGARGTRAQEGRV